MTIRCTAAAAVVFCVVFAGRTSAQIDYRNLDDERPVATEDAYPVERYAFELLLPYHVERDRGGRRQHTFPLGIAYGIYDNAQLSVEAPLGVVEPGMGDESDWGLAGLKLSAFYNLNTEGPHLPALSARTDVYLPVGALGGTHSRVSLKTMATRSWGRSRVHGNALWSFGADDVAAAAALPRWRYSLAGDRTFFRQSTLLVGEVTVSRRVADDPVAVNAAVGVRYQWSPTVVIDAGVGRRLGSEGPDYEVTFGLSHVFGLGWLMPRGAR